MHVGPIGVDMGDYMILAIGGIFMFGMAIYWYMWYSVCYDVPRRIVEP